MQLVAWVLALLLAMPGGAFAEGMWSGYWATTWRDGAARLSLQQQGDHVTGTYHLYGGRIDGIAAGERLEGRWFEDNKEGTFLLVMGRDGNSFVGRYDNGEWWTGARSTAPDGTTAFSFTTPREAFRRFLLNGNLARIGRPDAWGAAMLSVDFGAEDAALTRAERLQRVQELFSVIDLTTFRVWSIPQNPPGNTFDVRLEQAGTDASLTLAMTKDGDGNWHIRMPSQEKLDAQRRTLLASLGGQPPTADSYKRLQNPRDAMRSFLEGMADWGGAGQALALSTLDLSEIPEPLRPGQGALNAQFLRRVLDQIGVIGLQEITNDGANRTPYVHFSHPAGRIVIAPSGPEPGAPWRFTARTVADADDLFRAVDGLLPPIAGPAGLIPSAPYFMLRGLVRTHAPFLLGSIGPAEYWQILGILLLSALSAVIGVTFGRLIRLGTARLTGDYELNKSFNWAVGLAIGLGFASYFPTVIGVPEKIRRITYPIFGVTLTVVSSIAAWHLLGIAGVALQRLSGRTATAADDILFTLILASARLGVIAAGFLGVAYFLSIPTNGVLAGFGLGGLAFAFASRETLSNVFGAGILVADRPFRRGDWITSGDVEGAVEHVGIRSTRVRTAQDSIVVVPNGKLSDSTINNLGTRRHRLFKTQLLVTAGGAPQRLDAFTAAARTRICDDPAFVASRTDVAVSGITEAGIQIDVSTYLDVSTSSAERAAKHSLLLDVVRLAEKNGLTLGAGMLAEDDAPPAEEAAHPGIHAAARTSSAA